MSDLNNRISMNTTAIYLRELASDIKCGKIGIPMFQRKFIWDREQIIDLFDSIRRGYPIGSFLLWEREKDWKGTLDLLTDVPNPDAEPSSFILDGRQRLTSFYGCTLTGTDKPSAFFLAYDLQTQGFGYFKSTSSAVILVSEIYDTFSLLDRMDKIRKEFSEDDARIYIQRAKELNSILQEYVVSKVTIGKCSLDEATNVFSRLNSKGTDISKTFMMQAMSYRKEGDKLLVPALESIAEELNPFGFDGIGLDDLLNTCFKFENKNFYDLSLKEMESLMPLRHEDEVRATVKRTVRFLFEKCNVLSWTLVPYSKQFQALIWCIKAFPDPTPEQEQELKKWFYYTTLALSFQNGSIGNTRRVFNRLTQYIDGKKNTAIDYSSIDMPQFFDFKISGKSANSKLFILTLINIYRNASDWGTASHVRYLGHCHFGSTNPEAYFVLLSDEDKVQLNEILNSNVIVDPSVLAKYALTEEMLDYYSRGDIYGFEKLRREYILDKQTEFLYSMMPELFPIA